MKLGVTFISPEKWSEVVETVREWLLVGAGTRLSRSDCHVRKRAMSKDNSSLWLDAMKDELDFMAKNEVWGFVELPEGVVAIGCK
ncbi:hypothetical protein CRG98_030404 [Punica granatum]|uniref:Uncharacterized protein n=1 Tax=Punica granatum TaxID=22663 RepID=A0A2I0IZ03_PUNGR|nr:hypothetical protein CRG98_030404 [Punica granatum]